MRPKPGRPGKATFLLSLGGRVLSPPVYGAVHVEEYDDVEDSEEDEDVEDVEEIRRMYPFQEEASFGTQSTEADCVL